MVLGPGSIERRGTPGNGAKAIEKISGRPVSRIRVRENGDGSERLAYLIIYAKQSYATKSTRRPVQRSFSEDVCAGSASSHCHTGYRTETNIQSLLRLSEFYLKIRKNSGRIIIRFLNLPTIPYHVRKCLTGQIEMY